MRMGVRRQACLELTWHPCADGSTGMPAARRGLCEWKRREETESEGKRAIANNRKFSLAVKDEWMDGRMGERAGGGCTFCCSCVSSEMWWIIPHRVCCLSSDWWTKRGDMIDVVEEAMAHAAPNVSQWAMREPLIDGQIP